MNPKESQTTLRDKVSDFSRHIVTVKSHFSRFIETIPRCWLKAINDTKGYHLGLYGIVLVFIVGVIHIP